VLHLHYVYCVRYLFTPYLTGHDTAMFRTAQIGRDRHAVNPYRLLPWGTCTGTGRVRNATAFVDMPYRTNAWYE